MDKNINKIVKQYAELVKDIADIKTIVLYGSAARREMNESSDIDVAIIVDELE